jgi:hypothetical protein
VLLIISVIAVLTAGSVLLMLAGRMRLLASAPQSDAPLPDANRYRPMLRLLSEEDLQFAGSNALLKRRIGAHRRELFRGYLRCLTKDYGRLLGGIRRLMVESGVDRPDLAKALAKQRLFFALALCRVELHLQMHALGIGKVDVSGLVEALDALRGTVNVMSPVASAA